MSEFEHKTGKSFILEALDFMLGAGADLRDIPERVGYDRIFSRR
ncbi:MAG: hypothetical protein WA858_09170 [Xanthobacteraceae bacterium]|jgi:hypothetical protein